MQHQGGRKKLNEKVGGGVIGGRVIAIKKKGVGLVGVKGETKKEKNGGGN